MPGSTYLGEASFGAYGTGTVPTPNTFTAGVLADLAPWMDPAGQFYDYTSALGAMFEQVYGIVTPTGSPDQPATYAAGWSTLLDPTVCPSQFLPYCGQFVGIQIPSGTSASAARAQVIAEANFQVGTVASIIAAAKMWLSGTQSVTVLERQQPSGASDPYWLTVTVRPEEVISTASLTSAVLAVKPVGVNVSIVQNDWTISELESAYSSGTISTVESAFTSISNLEGDIT